MSCRACKGTGLIPCPDGLHVCAHCGGNTKTDLELLRSTLDILGLEYEGGHETIRMEVNICEIVFEFEDGQLVNCKGWLA